MKRYSVTVLIETDGDPAVALRSMAEAVYEMTRIGYGYQGPVASFYFSKPMTEAEAH